MKLKFIIKKGYELTEPELEVINKHRKLLFDNQTTWTLENMKGDRKNNVFILLLEGNEIVSFCRLRDIQIEFDGHSYDIFGLATVISVIQGKGHGKALMMRVIEYAMESKKTVIGFCEPSNSEFYRKSGFGIIPKGNLRFVYNDADGKEITDDGDVIYLEGEDNFINKFLKSSSMKAYHRIPHW